MLTFKPITVRDAGLLRRYYRDCGYELCEYSAGVKLMWRNTLHYTWAEAAGCLIIRCESEQGHVSFDYPVAGPEGDEDAALSAIEAYCLENGIQPEISVVPEGKTAALLARYPYARVSNIRTWRDYLYYKEDLQFFAGRRYSGQRNHIKKFRAQWPDAAFRPISAKDDAQAMERFWADYEKEFPDDGRALEELKLAKKMMSMADRPWLLRGGMFDGEKLIALSLCEKCGETLIIHIEKALYSYTGVYPAMVQAEVEAFGEGCAWVNREDDAGDRGLRTSKLQYGPAKLAPKYHFLPQNELLRHVSAIPTLTTERLTLSALTEADIPAYNALVLDGERNRWWGYDDVGSLTAPMTERSFYDVAQRDFENRLAVNFAVRLDGKLIGEAVLYNFDYRGGAELGCRVDRAYAGNGYGTEAFRAAAEWGLYQVNLNRVVAKCYKENEASYKMLSACMRKRGEDEKFFYFEKLV